VSLWRLGTRGGAGARRGGEEAAAKRKRRRRESGGGGGGAELAQQSPRGALRIGSDCLCCFGVSPAAAARRRRCAAWMGGCACSAPVDRATNDEEQLVGGVGRTVQQVEMADVPPERNAMMALEVAASRGTIYRKRMRQFHPDGSLDYNSNVSYLHLRNLLDEPVGRFYLGEFATEKKLTEMSELVQAWVTIHQLKTHKDLALETVLAVAKAEEERAKAAESLRNEKESKAKRGSKRLSDKLAASPVPAEADGDGAGAGAGEQQRATPPPAAEPGHDVRPLADSEASAAAQQYGYPVQQCSDDEIVAMSNGILGGLLKEGSGKHLGRWLQGAAAEVLSRTCQQASAAVAARDTDALRRRVWLPLQNAVFLRIVEGGYYTKFREHSEYKRYKLKYQLCYNTISHRDFDFMATLGKGSFGRVIRVRKKTTQAQFALKVMSKKKILSGAESAEQVTIERNVLVLCDCPSIVQPMFAFQTSRALFLALELLEGGTLVDAMTANGGTLSVDQARFIVAQMVLGLEHLHKHGILYRDLKPVNVMLDRKGNAVLTDMGLAAKFRDSVFPKEEGGVSSSGSRLLRRKSMNKLKPDELKCVGTYGYRAPEVLACSDTKKGYSVEVDYWALGVCTHYLVYARSPFSKKAQRKSLMAAAANPKDQEKRLHKEPLQFEPDIDPDLQSLVQGMLEVEPSRRLGRDCDALKRHPFFAPINWQLLAERKLKPVYRPSIPALDPDEKPAYAGLGEAMQQFAQGNALELFGGENEMTDEYTHVGKNQQKLFREWAYCPDEQLAQDWAAAGENRMWD
jgi:serine/threonine protein kinase